MGPPVLSGSRRRKLGGLSGGGQAARWSAEHRKLVRLPHGGEEHDLADRVPSTEQHHQPVDADADAPGGGHPVLQRAHEVLVVGLGLLVALGLAGSLGLEAGALLVGIVELAEGVGELDAAGKALEALTTSSMSTLR